MLAPVQEPNLACIWMPAVRHPLHGDDVPDEINAVIIGNVLNGSDVYGSGRHLALPISGGMCISLFRPSSTTNYRPMLNSVGTSTPAHPLVGH